MAGAAGAVVAGGIKTDGDAREALIALEAVRKAFFTHQRLVQILHSAVKPDLLAQEFSAPVAALEGTQLAPQGLSTTSPGPLASWPRPTNCLNRLFATTAGPSTACSFEASPAPGPAAPATRVDGPARH